jgi:hypothetical protein
MLRLSYPIGKRTLCDILPHFEKDVDTDKDVVVAVEIGINHNIAIIISKTEEGDSFISFMKLKHSGNPLVRLMKC